ncbi:MAG TPA: hypothetical protein VEH27_11840 [Methylomirabilota bacterium]|nr:hypothetical protein [Methylomirabilota bacterium]
MSVPLIALPRLPKIPDKIKASNPLLLPAWKEYEDALEQWRQNGQHSLDEAVLISRVEEAVSKAGFVTQAYVDAQQNSLVTRIERIESTIVVNNGVTNITGNASTATALATGRKFSITGKATSAEVSFNGTGDVTLSVTALSAAPGEIALPDTQFIVGNGTGKGTATAKSGIPISGFGAATATVDFGSQRLSNVASPTADGDAVNRLWVNPFFTRNLATYGADRTGVLDATPALQTALANGPVSLAGGTWYFNSTLTLPGSANCLISNDGGTVKMGPDFQITASSERILRLLGAVFPYRPKSTNVHFEPATGPASYRGLPGKGETDALLPFRLLPETIMLENLRTDFIEFAVYLPISSTRRHWVRCYYTNRFNFSGSGTYGATRLFSVTTCFLDKSTAIPAQAANLQTGSLAPDPTQATSPTYTRTTSQATSRTPSSWTAGTGTGFSDIVYSITAGNFVVYTVILAATAPATTSSLLWRAAGNSGNGGIANIVIKDNLGAEIAASNYRVPQNGSATNRRTIDLKALTTGLHLIKLADGLANGTYTVEITVDATNHASGRVYDGGVRVFSATPYNVAGRTATWEAVASGSVGGNTGIVMTRLAGGTGSFSFTGTKLRWTHWRSIDSAILRFKVYTSAGVEVDAQYYEIPLSGADRVVDAYSASNQLVKTVIVSGLPHGTYYVHYEGTTSRNPSNTTGYRVFDGGFTSFDQTQPGTVGVDEFDLQEGRTDIKVMGEGNDEFAVEASPTQNINTQDSFVGGAHGYESNPASMALLVDGAAADWAGRTTTTKWVGKKFEFSFTTQLATKDAPSSFWANLAWAMKWSREGYEFDLTRTTTADVYMGTEYCFMFHAPNKGAHANGFDLWRPSGDKEYSLTAHSVADTRNLPVLCPGVIVRNDNYVAYGFCLNIHDQVPPVVSTVAAQSFLQGRPDLVSTKFYIARRKAFSAAGDLVRSGNTANSKGVYRIIARGDRTPGEADTLNGQRGSYYLDASNMSAGILALSRGGTNDDLSSAANFSTVYLNGGAFTALAPNTTVTPKYLRMVGTGTLGQAPSWTEITFNDIPGILHSTQFPALTGDVATSAGSLTTTLTANAVTTSKINDLAITTAKLASNSVTYAKIQLIPTHSLIGNPTSGLTDATAIGIAGSLTFTGFNLQLSGDASSPGNSKYYGTDSSGAKGYHDLPAASTNADTLDGQDGAYYLDLANATGFLPAGRFPALTGDVTTTAGALATTISANAVTTSKINDLAITTAKIGSNQVTYGKLQQVAALSLIGNATGVLADAAAIGLAGSLVFSGGNLQLSGDNSSPGNSKYWGTDGSGAKGFHSLPSSTRTGVYRRVFIPARIGSASSVCSGYGAGAAVIFDATFNAFSNDSTDFNFVLPKEWELSDLKVKVYFAPSDASTGDIVLEVKGAPVSQGDDVGVSYGTADTLTVAIGSSQDGKLQITSAMDVALSSPTAEDLIILRLSRLGLDPAETYAFSIQVIGIEVQYKESTSEPASW